MYTVRISMGLIYKLYQFLIVNNEYLTGSLSLALNHLMSTCYLEIAVTLHQVYLISVHFSSAAGAIWICSFDTSLIVASDLLPTPLIPFVEQHFRFLRFWKSATESTFLAKAITMANLCLMHYPLLILIFHSCTVFILRNTLAFSPFAQTFYLLEPLACSSLRIRKALIARLSNTQHPFHSLAGAVRHLINTWCPQWRLSRHGPFQIRYFASWIRNDTPR